MSNTLTNLTLLRYSLENEIDVHLNLKRTERKSFDFEGRLQHFRKSFVSLHTNSNRWQSKQRDSLKEDPWLFVQINWDTNDSGMRTTTFKDESRKDLLRKLKS